MTGPTFERAHPGAVADVAAADTAGIPTEVGKSARYVTAGPMRAEPLTLQGQIVRLIPLTREHAEPLFAAANFPEIWRWTGTAPITSMDDMRAYIELALSEQAAGRAVPFAITSRATGEMVGSTRFGNMSAPDRRVEVGWTWLRPDLQRSGANREAKCLMLQQAFDRWGALRVEIKADVLNAKSRAAIERLGGTYEGTFRQHMVVRGGRVRDTVYYSILDTEWRDPTHATHRHALAMGITPRSEPVV